jgi:hypothetical protein
MSDSNSIQAGLPRPWWRLHKTTLVALAAVMAALADCQLGLHVYGNSSLRSRNTVYGYGWPTPHLEVWKSVNWDGTRWVASCGTRLHTPLVALGAVASVLLISSVAFVSERWRRRPNMTPWQFTVRNWLVGMTVGTTVATLYVNTIYVPWYRSEGNYHVIFKLGLWDGAWYVVVPMVFGVACIVYSVGWAACRILMRAARFVCERQVIALDSGRFMPGTKWMRFIGRMIGVAIGTFFGIAVALQCYAVTDVVAAVPLVAGPLLGFLLADAMLPRPSKK